MTGSIRVDKDLQFEMRDGVVLRCDVYRPDDAAKHPAIVIRTPYNKSPAIRGGGFLSPVEAAFAGYAVVIQDTRGRFASDGDWTSEVPEDTDGYDTVESVAAAAWCDGNVGTSGASYMARLQWETALLGPPHLKAISPAVGHASPLVQEVRMSGATELELIVGWLAEMADDTIDRMEREGRDVSEMRRMIARAQLDVEEVCYHLPLKDAPHFQFEGLSERFAGLFKADSALDRLASEDDLFWDYGKIIVPCFHSGGWYDIFAGSGFQNFLGMRAKGGTEAARESQHLLYGPWSHAALQPFNGGLHFGPVASGVAALVHEAHLAFFDRYLRGIEADIPAVRYFVMGRDLWQSAESWPLPQTEWRRLFLHSRGKANTAAGDGLLSWDEPGAQPADVFVYDPALPVPTLGGRTLPSGRLVPGPFDQTPLERRQDVLCYTTPEFNEDLEVTGPLVLHLFAATSAKDTDFMVKLVDVHPNGAAYDIAEGLIRARYRESPLHPKAITPGEVIEYRIDLASTSILFRQGHRIRIDVTSSNFPRVDRNMNTGNAFGVDAAGVTATQTIHHRTGQASYIDLPVIPAANSG